MLAGRAWSLDVAIQDKRTTYSPYNRNVMDLLTVILAILEVSGFMFMIIAARGWYTSAKEAKENLAWGVNIEQDLQDEKDENHQVLDRTRDRHKKELDKKHDAHQKAIDKIRLTADQKAVDNMSEKHRQSINMWTQRLDRTQELVELQKSANDKMKEELNKALIIIAKEEYKELEPLPEAITSMVLPVTQAKREQFFDIDPVHDLRTADHDIGVGPGPGKGIHYLKD